MRYLIEAAFRANATLGLVAAWLAALVMVAMTAHIMLEIVLRTFFARSTYLIEEYVGYGLAAMIFLGLAHTLERGGLIRVDIVLQRLHAPARRVLEVLICLAALATTGILIRYFWTSVARNWELGTISMTTAATPIWIPEAVILVGIVLFFVQTALYCLRLCLGGQLIEDETPSE